MKPVLRRLACEVRGIDEEARTATYVAATEGAVQTWAGPEVLRIHGARLARFRKNPVFVDSHRSYDAGSVIGSVKVKKEGRELTATVTYASTARAEEIWSLVRDGHLRAVSVGFIPNRKRIRHLREGETDGEGDAMVTGPARVVNEWELIELSQVAVPADEDAIRRSYEEFYGHEPKEERVKYPTTIGEVRGTFTPAEDEGEGSTAPKPKEAAGKVIRFEELPQERAAREAKALRDRVMAKCPESLRSYAEGLLAEHDDFEKIRAAIHAKWAEEHKPVGTPDAPTATKPAARTEDTPTTPKPAEVSKADLLAGLKRALGA